MESAVNNKIRKLRSEIYHIQSNFNFFLLKIITFLSTCLINLNFIISGFIVNYMYYMHLMFNTSAFISRYEMILKDNCYLHIRSTKKDEQSSHKTFSDGNNHNLYLR